MSDKILHPTLTITLGEDEAKEDFIFRVPTPMEKARLGVREASIRRQLDPMSGGWVVGVDDDTFFLIRGMAAFEVLLEKSSATWPYSEFKPERGPAELRVDINLFPPGKEATITEVGRRFQEALDTFHRDGAGHSGSAVSETLASGVDSRPLRSVSSAAA